MSKVPDNFCILPFLSLEVGTLGEARACCHNANIIRKNDKTLNINEDSIIDAFYSDTMADLRREFLENKRPDSCKICWEVEAANGDSKRIRSNEKFKWFVQKADHNDPALRFLDLKMGNICNLKCRICSVKSSSKWTSDSLEKDSSLENKKYVSRIGRLSHWPRRSERFWKDIQTVVDSLLVMYFAGGEPMLINEHFDLLRHCIETDNAKRISLKYNTNGTRVPIEAIEEIWPKFKKVHLGFSIDGTDMEFEYQRDGAKWQEINDNIDRIHAARTNLPSLETQLCTTVSALHIATIIDTIKWGEMKGFNTIVINLLHQPEYFCVRNLSSSSKIKVKDLLESRIGELENPDLRRQVQNVISYMMQEGQDLSRECIEELEKIDRIRNQDWRAALLELAEILDVR